LTLRRLPLTYSIDTFPSTAGSGSLKSRAESRSRILTMEERCEKTR